MPSLKAIRRRIASTVNTRKITRAMKLVAAAKLRRAQDDITRARPYADKLTEVVGELARHEEQSGHPLLAKRDKTTTLVIALTSERGLCGAFNANILRTANQFQNERADAEETVELGVIGKKGRSFCAFRNIPTVFELSEHDAENSRELAAKISDYAITRFCSGEVDEVSVIYNEFRSALNQQVTVAQLLPIIPRNADTVVSAVDVTYEPSRKEMLDTVLPMYVHVETHRVLLENAASEHGSRMTAMENATNNASDMVKSLTREYNKARQAVITKELLEIVTGAEAQ